MLFISYVTFALLLGFKVLVRGCRLTLKAIAGLAIRQPGNPNSQIDLAIE